MTRLRVTSVLALAMLAGPVYPESAPTREQQVAARFESIRKQPPQLVAFLRAMPKGGDLHSHLTGAVYAERLLEWAGEDGRCLDATTLGIVGDAPCDQAAGRIPAAAAATDPKLYRRVIDAWSMRNWQRGHASGHDQFFDTFGLAFGATRGRMGDMIADVTRRAAHNRVSYVELMITPDRGLSLQVGATLAWDDDLARLRTKALAAGLDRALAQSRAELDEAERRRDEILRCGTAAADPGCGVEVRYIFQVLRGFPREQVFAQMVAAFEVASTEPRVVGVNLVMPEDWLVPRRDFALHMRMLDAMKRSRPAVHITLHAGELWPGLVPPDELRGHVRDSIRLGHAERIGHGTDVMHEDDPHGLLREMARRRIPVEVILSSSDGILGVRGADHPLSAYLAAGVPVVLATDDEGVSRSDMSMEYVKAVEEQGLGYLQLKAIARASLEHAFVDATRKARLLRAHDDAVERFEVELLRVEQPGGAANP